MHRCTQRAAGGTIHRLKPGPAMVCLRSRKESRPMMLPPDVTGPFRKDSAPAVRLKPRASSRNRETVLIAVETPDKTKNSRGSLNSRQIPEVQTVRPEPRTTNHVDARE